MDILIADNDVLVEIFDQLYHANRGDFCRLVAYLQTRYSRIWIPRTVLGEFRVSRKRVRLINKLHREFPDFIEECPVRVSAGEIGLLTSSKAGIHEGEADGIHQAKKAETLRRYPQGFVFFSRDAGALRFAKQYGIDILDFGVLKETVREAGIVL